MLVSRFPILENKNKRHLAHDRGHFVYYARFSMCVINDVRFNGNKVFLWCTYTCGLDGRMVARWQRLRGRSTLESLRATYQVSVGNLVNLYYARTLPALWLAPGRARMSSDNILASFLSTKLVTHLTCMHNTTYNIFFLRLCSLKFPMFYDAEISDTFIR